MAAHPKKLSDPRPNNFVVDKVFLKRRKNSSAISAYSPPRLRNVMAIGSSNNKATPCGRFHLSKQHRLEIISRLPN